MFCSVYVHETQQQVRIFFEGVNPFELDAGIWRLMETPSTPTDAPRPVDQLWIITWYTCPPRISSYAPFTFTKKVRKGVKSVKPSHLNSMPPASDGDPEYTNGRATTRRPTLDHNMVYVPGKNPKLRPFYAHQKGAKRCKKSVKPAHLNSMPASDEDAVYTNGRPASRGPTLDHNMVCVPTKNIKLRPFYAHQKGAKRCKKCQTSTSQLDAGV